MKNKAKLFLAALAAFVLSVVALPAEMADGIIQVGKVRGKVELMDSSGERVELKTGAVLRVSDRIQIVTGEKGSASLWFQNGVRVIVKPGSDLSISSFQISADPKLTATDFDKQSAEPTHSKMFFWLAFGEFLFEGRKLNLPLTNVTVITPYVKVNVLQKIGKDDPPSVANVFSAQQTEEYARIASSKGAVHAWPQFDDIGPEVDIGEGKSAIFRRFKKQEWGGINNEDFGDLTVGDDVTDPGDLPIPLVPNAGVPDTSIIGDSPDTFDPTLLIRYGVEWRTITGGTGEGVRIRRRLPR